MHQESVNGAGALSDVATHPQASFTADHFVAKGGDAYEAPGKLTIRGAVSPALAPSSLPIPLVPQQSVRLRFRPLAYIFSPPRSEARAIIQTPLHNRSQTSAAERVSAMLPWRGRRAHFRDVRSSISRGRSCAHHQGRTSRRGPESINPDRNSARIALPCRRNIEAAVVPRRMA
jgi:hypothetical protein